MVIVNRYKVVKQYIRPCILLVTKFQGIPYNKTFLKLEELTEIGTILAGLNPDIQVTVLDYRPELRVSFLQRPSLSKMKMVKEILVGSGLTNLICQTKTGYIK